MEMIPKVAAVSKRRAGTVAKFGFRRRLPARVGLRGGPNEVALRKTDKSARSKAGASA